MAFIGRKKTAFSLVSISVVALLFLQGSSFASVATPKKPFHAVVVKVVDGDTIDVKNSSGVVERVRVYGIDTPEKWEPCFKEASRLTKNLVTVGEVKVLPRGRGRYGRLLGFVITDDRKSLGLELLKNGMARVYSNGYAPKNEETYKRYKLAQIHAMSGADGIWGKGCRI